MMACQHCRNPYQTTRLRTSTQTGDGAMDPPGQVGAWCKAAGILLSGAKVFYLRPQISAGQSGKVF